jgi:drug/metabolite transporter (DMT)-like permease
MGSTPRVGIACVALASFLWGAGTVVTAAILKHGIPVGVFTVVEIGSSVVFLALALLVSRTRIPSPRKHPMLLVLGLLEPGLTYLLINAGLNRTSVVHAALIQTTEPVIVAGLGWLLLSHHLPARVLIPMLTVLAGSVAVVTAHAPNSGATVIGDLLVAGGIISASAYALGSSRVDPDLSALGATFVQQAASLVLVVPVVLVPLLLHGHASHAPSGHAVGSSHPSAWLWVAVPALGVVSTSLTFWLYLTALRHIPPGTAAQFLAITPVTGFVGAVVFLGETMSLQATLGAGVVIFSLVAIARGEQKSYQEELAAGHELHLRAHFGHHDPVGPHGEDRPPAG